MGLRPVLMPVDTVIYVSAPALASAVKSGVSLLHHLLIVTLDTKGWHG